MDVLIHKKYPDELARYLFKVYQDKIFCDTVIHTPDGGAFQVHKIVVTASSTYLHNVLSQARQVHSSFSVDVRADILQVILEFMYTGQLFVSDLTRTAISEAATYLQVYPVIDLLKETAEDEFTTDTPYSPVKADEDNETNKDKIVHPVADQTAGYDSENTIVDETELLAVFKTLAEDEKKIAALAEEEKQLAKGRKKHPRKQQVTARRLKSKSTEERYKATKLEKFDVSEKNSKAGKNSNNKLNLQTDTKKQTNKSFNTPNTRSKTLSSESAIEPSSKIILRSHKQGKNKSKRNSIRRSKSKRKSLIKYELEEPVTKIKLKIKTDKANREEANKLSVKNEKVVKNEKCHFKVKLKGKKPVKLTQTEVDDPKGTIKSPKIDIIKRKVFKPSIIHKCVCGHCKQTFPGFIYLRKHLLLHHKQSFVDDWEFSRYLIKFYSGINKYVENCSVDIRGKQNKYKCKRCMKMFSRYSLHCLHFQRNHMKKNLKPLGKFTIISRKLIRLENFLRGILHTNKAKDRVKKEKTVECSYCSKLFVSNYTLKIHQKKMHGVEMPQRCGWVKRTQELTHLFQCALCEGEKYMSTQLALQKHLKDTHKLDDGTARLRSHEVPYEMNCEVISCTFKTNNILQMKTHVAFSHPFIQHPCNECQMVFQVRLMLERHKVLKHAVKQPCNYICSHCDKRFPKLFRLKVHEFYKHGIEHADIKIYRCNAPGCQYVTASQSSLRIHGSKHLKDKPFTCEYCGLKLKTTLSHQKHINKMHLGIRPYLCQVCGQNFGEDHELKSHIRNKHTTECDFQCEHCPYATTNKGTFYTHLYNVHKVRAEDDKRKEFRCPHPGCNFVSILHHRYQTHLNGHTNTRTYCCKPCNKWFVSSSTLRAHKQWYHSDKLHSCTQCSYQTKTSQKLNEHVRVQHQLKGLKPFKCPYCEFRCATGGNTRKHVKQVHRGRVVTYLRDDQILNAAKMARASGQNQPLINIMPPEALSASVPSSYPASAKKLGLIPDPEELEMVQIEPEDAGQTILVSTKLEEEHLPSTGSQIMEPANQMILSAAQLDVVSPTDPRTQGPVDLGAQVTVDINSQLPAELRNQLSAELRCQIAPGLRSQLTADLHSQIPTDIHNQIAADIRNQLSVEQTMQLASTGQHIPFSAGHYIPAVSSAHHIPLTSHHLMPMMVAPQIQVSVGSYEEVKDSGSTSDLTIIG